jgi:hypothetical protein
MLRKGKYGSNLDYAQLVKLYWESLVSEHRYSPDNFVRINKTLRVTPAKQASITKKLWSVGDLVKLLRKVIFIIIQ